MDSPLPPGAPALTGPFSTGPFSTGHLSPTSLGAEPLGIAPVARRVGAWAWAERSLYEVVGSWVPSTSGPAAKVYFDCCSQHHAWRAQALSERLPGRLVQAYPGAGLPQMPPELLGPPPGPAEEAARALSKLEGDAARLGAYCRVVLARCAVGYQAWRRRCSLSSDRPVARVLSLVLADVLTDWQDGTAVLMELLEGPGGQEAVTAAAGATSELERCLLGLGVGVSQSRGEGEVADA